jgi:hypothetical protein
VTYAAGLLTAAEIESVGYSYGDPDELNRRYLPGRMKTDFCTTADGEDYYFISNPATGLWKARE